MIWYINVAVISFTVGVVFGVALVAFIRIHDARAREIVDATAEAEKEDNDE